MNFLVVSRVSIPAKDRTLPAWEHLRSLGHTVTVEHPDSVPSDLQPDVMISMGITIMEETFRALERFPLTPLYCYNWDVYAWVWTNPRPGEYDYRRYGELLAKAREVWVPSVCTGRRTEQWYGLKNWRVILSACPWWDWPEEPCPNDCLNGFLEGEDYDGNPIVNEYGGVKCMTCNGRGKIKGVRDEGYALCCLREIPDPWWGMFERCCEELGIPYEMPKHEKTYEEYQDLVAGCRFLCAPLFELSTGGLSLLEGYRLGKPVLLSDSEWNGGRDYFGDRAKYFMHGDETNFKYMLRWMHDYPWENSKFGGNRTEHKEWIEANFNDRRMVEDMLRAIKETT